MHSFQKRLTEVQDASAGWADPAKKRGLCLFRVMETDDKAICIGPQFTRTLAFVYLQFSDILVSCVYFLNDQVCVLLLVFELGVIIEWDL